MNMNEAQALLALIQSGAGSVVVLWTVVELRALRRDFAAHEANHRKTGKK